MKSDFHTRLLKHKSALLGLCILSSIITLAIVGSLFYSKDIYSKQIAQELSFQAPTPTHWMGTDKLGRDIFEGLCIGARTSLSIAVKIILFAMTIGTVIGAGSAYFGKWLDLIIMRIIDIVQAFPSILLAITIMASFGRSNTVIVFAIAVPIIPVFVRQVRAAVLVTKEQDYTQASRALGAGHWRVLTHEILPNTMAPIITVATLSIGTAILDIAGLSFLGLGVPAGNPEWGTMLKDAWDAMSITYREWWTIVFPGLAIALTVLGFNLFGDGLRDTLDPKMKKNR